MDPQSISSLMTATATATAATGRPMEIKRPHTKSRRGCVACKARKVKCDEKHPLCGNCARRFPDRTSCDYNTTFLRAGPHQKGSSISVHSNNSSVSYVDPKPSAPIPKYSLDDPMSIQPPRVTSQRGLELRIWHHYLTNTAATLPPPARPDIQSMWTEEIPVWACEYDFLLESILGMTAIHIHLETPEPGLLSCAYNYYAEAASKYRKALSNINSVTAGPVLATSCFIGFQSKIVPRLHEAGEPYRLPIGMFYLQRGIPTTYKAVAPYLQGHRLAILLFSQQTPVEDNPACDDGQFLPKDVYQDALEIVGLLDASETMQPAAKDACKSAFAYILAIHRSAERDDASRFAGRNIPAFFWLVPWPFVELLERKNPIAMLILARYFAISKTQERMWWLRGLADREVLGIASIIPSQWAGYMDFPLRLVNSIDTPEGSVGSRSRASPF